VRVSKRDLQARVKGDPEIEYSREKISAYGGLEIFRRYLRSLDLRRRLHAALAPHGLNADYGAARMVFAVLALIVVGGMRVSHIAYLSVDPVVLRFCALKRLPNDRTLARWLKRFGDTALLALETLVRDLVHDQIEHAKFRRLTVDLDGTVLRTGAKVEGAFRGFNPHHPKDCSYYPITAHVAELGQILRIWNRPGNVNDSHNAHGFLSCVLADLRARFGARISLRVRMDGAFFLPSMLRFLDKNPQVGWAMKVPLWQWLGIRAEIAKRTHWTRVDPRIDGFDTALILRRPGWPDALRVTVYRKRVYHRTAKNFQLDLFSPDDGTFEYSAVATNLDLGVPALWHFMAGRGGHEKTLGELKQCCALGVIPTSDRHANSAWQMLSVLALNLTRSFQIRLDAARRPRTLKSTTRYVLQSLKTLRFELIHLPLRVVRPAGRTHYRFAVPPAVQKRLQRTLAHLERAA
jgi:hypothetical protein